MSYSYYRQGPSWGSNQVRLLLLLISFSALLTREFSFGLVPLRLLPFNLNRPVGAVRYTRFFDS